MQWERPSSYKKLPLQVAKRAWETGKMATEEFREALREPHLHLQVSILNTFIITISIVVTKVTFAIVIAPVFENHYPSVVIFILTVVIVTMIIMIYKRKQSVFSRMKPTRTCLRAS